MALNATNLKVNGNQVSFTVSETGNGKYTYSISDPMVNSNTITITVNAQIVQQSNIVGVFVNTWGSTANGFSSINWNVINWVCVFQLQPSTTGTVAYNTGGNTPINYATTVSTTHSHSALCFVCLGGYLTSSQNQGLYSLILNSQSIQTALITNTIAAAKLYGYDGIVVDFENINAGDFSGPEYTAFIANITAAAHAQGLLVYVCWADWMVTSVNPTNLQNACDRLLDMIYPNGNVLLDSFESNVVGDSGYVSNPTNMAIGFEFTSDTPPSLTTAQMLPMMQYLVQHNYSMFFWQASAATAAQYTNIGTALGQGGGSNTYPTNGVLQWMGYAWNASSYAEGNFQYNTQNVYVDPSGYLHLTMTTGAKTQASELLSSATFGYGTFQWLVQGPINNFDPAAVFGLFTWDNASPSSPDPNKEIDFIEASKWAGQVGAYNMDSEVQIQGYGSSSSNYNQWTLSYTGDVIITGIWEAGRVTVTVTNASTGAVLNTWTSTISAIPTPGGVNIDMNFWQYVNTIASNQSAVIKSFTYVPG